MRVSLFSTLIIIVISLLILTGCSSKNLMSKSIEVTSITPSSNLGFSPSGSLGNREIVGIWNAEIDPVQHTFKIEPVFRGNAFHIPLTNFYPNVLSVTAYGWTPYFWADIKLSHPLPNSKIDAFDPRVIAILPAKPGVSSEFPDMDILTNDSVLRRCDGFTKLWDNPSIPGNTNPFLAYFKNEPYRTWSSTGKTSETRRWHMNLSGFGGALVYQLVVDVCTNYPNAPQPIVDNAPEPVDIFIDIEPGIKTYPTEEKIITASIFSWRGLSGIGEVIASCPALFNGIVRLEYSGIGLGGTFIYRGTFKNEKFPPNGNYKMMVGARASDRPLYLYKECRVHVGLEPEYPSLIKVLNTQSTILHVDIDNDYAFFGDGSNLYAVDVLYPENAQYVKSISGQGYNLSARNGYVFMTSGAKVEIYDADPVEFLHKVKQVNLISSASCQDIEGHYLYTVGADSHIIDISNIENASIVKWLEQGGNDVSVNNGFMYLANGDLLDICVVNPPETAYYFKSISVDCPITGVHATGNLCCVSEHFPYPDPSYGLDVIDISFPYAPVLIGSLSTTTWDQNLYISGKYVYMAEYYSLYVIRIANPSYPYKYSEVTTATKCVDVCVRDNYAYLPCRENGLSIVKLW